MARMVDQLCYICTWHQCWHSCVTNSYIDGTDGGTAVLHIHGTHAGTAVFYLTHTHTHWLNLIDVWRMWYLMAGTVVGTNGVAAHMLTPPIICGTLILTILGTFSNPITRKLIKNSWQVHLNFKTQYYCSVPCLFCEEYGSKTILLY